MGVKKDIIDTPLKITEIFRVGPRVKAPRDKRDWDFLIYELKKLKVTPGEAYRIIAEKKDKKLLNPTNRKHQSLMFP